MSAAALLASTLASALGAMLGLWLLSLRLRDASIVVIWWGPGIAAIAGVGSDWLPYIDKHMAAGACETCHIPQMYAPAIQSYDWTVLTLNSEPVKTCRGVEGEPNQVTSLVTGYEPVLLNRTHLDGDKLLTPYNLITTYYWVYDDANGNKRPASAF